MTERTPTTLADLFEPELKKNKGVLGIVCKTWEEAVALAAVLQSRGWKAKASKAIDTDTDKIFDAVDCSGRKRANGGGNGL